MKTIKNTHVDLKLHEINNKKLAEIHRKDLGLTVPEDYFAKSKLEILKKVKEENPMIVIPFYQKKQNWMLAASLIFLLGFSFYLINTTIIVNNKTILPTENTFVAKKTKENNNLIVVNKVDTTIKMKVLSKKNSIKPTTYNTESNIETTNTANNLLIESLFIEENQLNDYVTNYMLEDI